MSSDHCSRISRLEVLTCKLFIVHFVVLCRCSPFRCLVALFTTIGFELFCTGYRWCAVTWRAIRLYSWQQNVAKNTDPSCVYVVCIYFYALNYTDCFDVKLTFANFSSLRVDLQSTRRRRRAIPLHSRQQVRREEHRGDDSRFGLLAEAVDSAWWFRTGSGCSVAW